MRTSDHVAVEVAAEDFGVAAHDALRHGKADIREQFVAIQTEQLYAASVQKEAVERKPRVAEPGAHPVIVDRFPVHQKSGNHVVKVRSDHVPKCDRAEVGERQFKFRLARSSYLQALTRSC